MHNLLDKVILYTQSILLSLLLCHYKHLYHYISFHSLFLFLLYRMIQYLLQMFLDLLLLYLFCLLPLYSMYGYLLNFLMFHLVCLLDMLLFNYFFHYNKLHLFLHNTLYLSNSLNLLDSIHLLHNRDLYLIQMNPMISFLVSHFLLV